MATYEVYWSSYGSIEIDANSQEEADMKARKILNERSPKILIEDTDITAIEEIEK